MSPVMRGCGGGFAAVFSIHGFAPVGTRLRRAVGALGTSYRRRFGTLEAWSRWGRLNPLRPPPPDPAFIRKTRLLAPAWLGAVTQFGTDRRFAGCTDG